MSTIAIIMIEVKKLPDGGYIALANNLLNDHDGYSVNIKGNIEDLNPGIKECLDKLLTPVK